MQRLNRKCPLCHIKNPETSGASRIQLQDDLLMGQAGHILSQIIPVAFIYPVWPKEDMCPVLSPPPHLYSHSCGSQQNSVFVLQPVTEMQRVAREA